MTTLMLLGWCVAAGVLLMAGLLGFTCFTAWRVEKALPPAGRFVEVPGARLHVHEQGPVSAPVLLLIHGLAGQMHNYLYGVVEPLARQFRVITVDRPGSGYSVRGAATAADLATQAAALAALIEQLQLGRPLVVGHSLGGALGLALALDHPERVAGLALLAPLTQMHQEPPAVFKVLAIESRWLRTLLAWTLVTPGMMAGTARALAQVFGPEPTPADYATRGGGLLGLRPSHFLAASADMQALPQRLPAMEARYGELRLPVAILYGRDDRILDPAVNGAAFAAKVAGATLELIEGGHMLPVTQPERTVDFIRDVAARCAQAAPSSGCVASTS